MKKLIVATSILLLSLSAFLLIKKFNYAKDSVSGTVATNESRTVDDEDARQEKKNAELQERLREAQKKAVAKVEENENLKQQLATAKNEKPSAEIFNEPEMKDALKAQAKQAAEHSVNELFKAGLAKQLGLNGDQAWALKELLMKKQSIFWDKVMLPMAAGELTEANMAESGRATKQALEENTAQIRVLLGNDGFDACERFEKAQADRENVKQLSPKFTAAGKGLNAEQQSQLLAAMTEERANFKFKFDIGDPTQWNFENLYDNFTDDKINAYAREAGQLNERITQRAQNALTTEQIVLLKNFLAQQLQQSRLTARMTTAMFGKKR
jgi:hypothetical protein